MNRKRYTSDPRYSKVLDNMDLLGIVDITTTRQDKNGTIVWRLPIKNNWNNGKLIEVASFSTGYVRNQNSGYSNYQLNKRQFEDEYFQAYEWKNDKQVKIPNQFRKWQRKTCVLIPIEIDRLEYLISYCLKNYYIKNANQVADGKYVSKWYHEWELEKANETYSENTGAMERIGDLENAVSVYEDRQAADYTKIRDLEERLNLAQEDLSDVLENRDYYKEKYNDYQQGHKVTPRHMPEVKVIVNGQRYNVI